MRTFIVRTSSAALTAIAFALATPSSAHAQTVAGPRWLGWLGCWSVAPADGPTEGLNAPRTVCITPTSDADVVNISAVAEGKIVSRDRIDASGRPQAIEANGCRGTQTARWSGDERRVFLKSSVNCGSVQTEMSALIAMTPNGTWLDVRRVAAGNGADVRVARYRDVAIPADVPTEISSALNIRGNFIVLDARLDTGSPVGPNAITEAARMVDADVVETWVMESGQRYAIDAHTLTQMADAGVPARVTDAMIAVTNEEELAERGASDVYLYSPYGWNAPYGHYGRGSADAWNQGTGSRFSVSFFSYDPWGNGLWPFGVPRFGNAPFGYGLRYGRGDFGVDSNWPYAYGSAFGAYGYNPGNRVGYYYPPTIVLHDDPTNTAPRGRAVKGEGYVPDVRQAGSSQQPREAHPRTDGVVAAVVDAARAAASGGERSTGEAKGEAKGGTSSPQSASPRTAKARP
ncbi:MAG: hypothetical protein ABJE10_10630 [bacterium]